MDLKDVAINNLLNALLVFPSPCGVLDLKADLKEMREQIGKTSVSVPLRGNGSESQRERQQQQQQFVVFPSPCGVMVMKFGGIPREE